MNNIDQIVENLEHPVVQEMRQQLQEQREEYERKLEEKQTIIDDSEWNFNSGFSELEDLFFKKNDDGKLEKTKLSLTEFIEKAERLGRKQHTNDALPDYINLRVVSLLENIKPEIIVKTEVVREKYIPRKIYNLLVELTKEINLM